MAFADGIQEFIDRSNNVLYPDFYKLPVQQQRDLYMQLNVEFAFPEVENVRVSSQIVRGPEAHIPVRIYTPASPRRHGVVFYLRGGGFVLGSADSHHSAIADLCRQSGLTVVAPDFRLAPEHPFPAPLEDCYVALQALRNGELDIEAGTDAVIIAGDSSGANMAVVVAMMVRDRQQPPLAGQALISPVLDFSRWRHGGDDAPLLSGGEMEFFTACYAPTTEQVRHAYVSPLISGSFHDLPPAYIMGASEDSLVQDAVRYSEHLQQQGIAVELTIEPGLVHAPLRARQLSRSMAQAWARYCDAVSRLARVPEEAY
ncbi:alpha/beta hydrolase [Gynuella sp.]|uniref:alpha/beta hydrolase n=1 Tax=Gynuella sp. TaxID=2969146 RepID=UPI003D0CA239